MRSINNKITENSTTLERKPVICKIGDDDSEDTSPEDDPKVFRPIPVTRPISTTIPRNNTYDKLTQSLIINRGKNSN